MAQIEKTVFISYRRTDISWALLVYHHLTSNGYDVFFDYTSIPGGDFEQIIISNIKARAHFLVILTPTALDRCSEPSDWLRREIETAINEKRNIIPLFFDGFGFDAPSVVKVLTGQLGTLKRYNGLEVPSAYFNEAMERLKNQFLNVILDAVLHPVSKKVKKVVNEQKIAANQALTPKKEIEEPRKNKLQKASTQPKAVPQTEQKVDRFPDCLMIGEFEYCRIPAGSFLMGSNDKKDEHAYDDEKPQHTVDIPYDYYMARFPVTNEQYNNFVQAMGEKHPVKGWLLDWKQIPDHPVVKVSWHNAVTFCHWLNGLLKDEIPNGLVVRLPTEAEWEKAARGTDGRVYPWGNTFDEDNCNTDEGGELETTPVDLYSPEGDSPYGCADMSGNVDEWTHSLYQEYPYLVDDGREDEESDGDDWRVYRGGSWEDGLDLARVASRNYDPPSETWDSLGFRVVVAPALASDRLEFKDVEFCHVPAGPFLMGSNKRKDKAAEDDEEPQHTVDIPYDYYMARFPITNEQYMSFVQSQNRSHPVWNWKSKKDHPVVEVSWQDAMDYCRWRNNSLRGKLPEGMVLRLPTEAEWEKSARGTDGRIYPWGNTFDEDNCNTFEGLDDDTTPVDNYSPEGDSPYGCADMCGNVDEWTHSLYKDYPYVADDGREDEESTEDNNRVNRGGTWDDEEEDVRIPSRFYDLSSESREDLGFRVVIAPKL